MNFPNGSVLDIGCGEGTLSDFLTPDQKTKYLGVDISKEAVRIGRTKRGLNFVQGEAETFIPDHNFDVIVFNEMLYYVEHVDVMKRFAKFLNPNGIIVISVWYSKKIDYLRNSIFKDAEKLFPSTSLGAIDISGKTLNLGKYRDVSFQIEAYRPASS
jgi:2-polyprenyl-3-methyl-5-hydroxy-6-metoxy-1,4-benzoquinol methylase